MSSAALSSLSSVLGPSCTAASEDVLVRSAPPRTYGRQRPAPPISEAPPLTSLLQPLSEPHISPAKGLLNRWSVASTSWRDSLASLDVSQSGHNDAEAAKKDMDRMRREARAEVLPRLRAQTPEDDFEVDLEEAKREMERMRREARGEAVPKQTMTAPDRLLVPNARLAVTFSSSSLTAPPTSSPHSSPPKPSRSYLRTEDSMQEETMPIRKFGAAKLTGRVKRVITPFEDEESGEEPLRLISQTRGQASSPRRSSTPSDDDRHIPQQATSSLRASRRAKARHPRPTPDSDEQGFPVDNVQKFLSTLAGEDDQQPGADRQESTDSINDPVRLFDDGDGKKPAKSRMVRGSKPIKASSHLPCIHRLLTG